jgi:hypothetical protein
LTKQTQYDEWSDANSMHHAKVLIRRYSMRFPSAALLAAAVDNVKGIAWLSGYVKKKFYDNI